MEKKSLNKRILYVEDDTFTQEEVLFFLKKIVDNDVLVANNGQEGLAIFSQEKPDLVITDIRMPIMNGIEMIKSIRKLDKNIPIIILTALNESEYLLEALKSGVKNYIFKPINLKELYKSIFESFNTQKESIIKFVIDKKGVIVDVDNEWLEYLSYEKEQVRGRNLKEYVDLSFHKEYENALDLIDVYKSINNLHLQLMDNNGALKEVILDGKLLEREAQISCELKSIKYILNDKKETLKLLDREKYISSIINIHASIGKNIPKEKTIESFYKSITDSFIEVGNFQVSMIVEYDQSKYKLKHYRSEKAISKIYEDSFEVHGLTFSVMDQVIATDNIVLINNIDNIDNFHNKEEFIKNNLHSVIGIPIYKTGEKVVILVLAQQTLNKIANEEVELFQSIATTIDLTIQSINAKQYKEQLLEQLHLKATRDVLTGTYNRQEGINIINKEISRALRYKHPLTLIFLDIDHFKAINDKYGHDVGDKALVAISEILKNVMRFSDYVIRWGGEEFVIILPETAKENVVSLVTKIQVMMLSVEIKDISLTASFGITEYIASESIEEFIQRSDQLMYKAKLTGRDRYIID